MSVDLFSPEEFRARFEAWKTRQSPIQSSLPDHVYQQKVRINDVLSRYGNQKISEMTGIDDRSIRKWAQFTNETTAPARFWDAVRILENQ